MDDNNTILKDLGELVENTKSAVKAKFSYEDVSLSGGFKKAFAKNIASGGNTIEYLKSTAIITTSAGLKIYLPNQWFVLATYPVELIKEIIKYRNYTEKVIDSNMSGDSYRIGTLLLPDVADKAQEGYQLLIQTAQTKNITVAYLSSGANLTYGALSLLCLNPPSGSGFSSANDESIVLSLRYNDFSCLLTGDLAGEGEEEVRRILASASLRKAYNIPEHYTLLKIAHHGSKNSSDEELLSLIRPEYALISCGRHNRYGHPHKELLQRLKNCHAGIFRTDQSGALTVTVKRRVTIRGYLDKTPSKLARILFP